jgi:hypothetical protein
LIAAGRIEDLRAQEHRAANTSLEDLFLQLTGGDEIAEIASHLGES